MKTVYLGGPIAGISYKDCNDWREFAIKELAKDKIIGISPTRYKGQFNSEQIMTDQGYGNIMTTGKGIITRDRYDTTSCDVFLANLLGADKVSIGTMFEYAWADLSRKPIITVIEKEGNPHEHNFVREVTGYRVETLEEGLLVAKAILCP